MKYTIISLNDDRKSYKDALRETVQFEEIMHPAVDGRTVDLPAEIAKRGLQASPNWPDAKKGEIGIWLSCFDRWELAGNMDEPLITFEDDAIADVQFNSKLSDLMAEVPEDWDFVALWVPENQRQDFLYSIVYNAKSGIPQFLGYTTSEQSIYRIPNATIAALAYQGYGMVSLMYSPQGGKRLVERARTTGITGPVDCWIYEQSKMGYIKGFAPRPEHANIVHYDWAATSHVQLTEHIHLIEKA